MKSISVIVPIHNAEKYLSKCISSILSQTYKDLEVILVEDLSTDGSGQICDEFAQNDSRVHVIHRSLPGGEGGAVARNEGIAASTGELLYFIDSDDYIDEEDMLERMVELMEKDQSDTVVSSFEYVDSEENHLDWYTPNLSMYGTMSGVDAAKIFLTTRDIEGFSWNKLIKKELLNKEHICFDESMNSFVDMYGMFRTILFSKKVSFYHKQPYHYRQHDVSCVHTMSIRKLGNFWRVINQIARLSNENGCGHEAAFFLQYRMILQLFDAVKAKKNYGEEWVNVVKEYRWRKMFSSSAAKTVSLLFKFQKNELMKTLAKFCVVRLYF